MNDAEELVVLVDESGRDIGTAPKLEAHRSGALHRAVSVFLFDARGRLLLQRRADGKYHSAGLWSNTCCSHPRPEETPLNAARRRLRDELGVDAELSEAFSFSYFASLGNGLVEHELDHIFTGQFDGTPQPDPAEVSAYRWVTLADLKREMSETPDRFTAWLALVLSELLYRQVTPKTTGQ